MVSDPSFLANETEFSVRLDLNASEVAKVLAWTREKATQRWNYREIFRSDVPAFSTSILYVWFESNADAMLFHLNFR